MEDSKDELSLSAAEAEPGEEPLGSVNGKPETDDKENNNGVNADETQAVRYDSTKDYVRVGFVIGVNGHQPYVCLL